MLGVGLGLGTGLFPLLSLYLGGEVICFKRKKRHLCLNCFWSSFIFLPWATVDRGQAGIELFMGVGAL